MNRDPFSKFHTKTKNEKRKTKNEKRKRKLKSVKSKVTKRKNGEHKVNSNFVSFPAGKKWKTKMEVQFRFFAAKKNEKRK